MISASPAPFLSSAAPLDLLQAALEISLTGFVLLRPLYSAADPLTITDLAYEYLNPAAQRMLRLPERPAESFLTLYPHAVNTGIFAFYRDTFLAEEAGRYDVNYQHDGLDNYFQLTARRAGDLLVVSFSDTAEQPRTEVETALRESQAAEQAARAEASAQHQRFYDVLLHLPAQVATYHGPDHVVAFVNPSYQRYFSGQALVGSPLAEALPEAQTQGFIGLLDHVYQTGEPFRGREVEFWLDVPGTGEREQLFLNACFYPLRDAQGRIDGVLDFSYDVTEQVRARQQVEHLNQELEASVEERTRSLRRAQAEVLAAAQQQVQQRETLYQVFAQTPAMIQLLRGPNHHVEYVNPAYQHLFPGRTLVGSDLAEAVPELREQGFIAILDDVYQTGITHFGLEVPLLIDQPDGQPPRTAYFTFTYQPYREMGQIVGISLFAHEVTEQVWARLERDVQRQRLHDLFMQAPAAICILGGPSLVYELVNPIYASLFPGRELPGHAIADIFPELAGTGVVETFQHVYQTGLANEEKSILIPFTDPATGQLEDRYFDYVQQARRDAYGQPDGVLVFAFEVTEQVLARQQVEDLNQELAAINEELQATNEELGDSNQQLTRVNIDLDNFIYTASHDLKAPISNLEGLLFLLREELPVPVAQSEFVAPTLALMLDAVERFKRTIDYLTEVSKLQKEHTPTLAAVDLAAVVEDVRQDLAPLLRDTNAQLNVAVADFPAILFSEKNLRSVVYNLLSNALKYRHPDRRPHVDVQAHVQGRFTVLEVHDNGLGLASQHLAKLFTMFQRFHTHVEGTGIGLFMVKRMVENAGGRIEVHSQLGAGTTFFVHLPHAPTAS